MNAELFDEYADYLIGSFGPATATGLSRLTDGRIRHDQVTRFLAAEDFTSPRLWRMVKPMVRQHEQDDGVLLIDNSIIEKPYSDEIDIVCRYWDHAHSRLVIGIKFLSAFYHVAGVVIPVVFDIATMTVFYTDPKSAKRKRKSAVSQHERYRALIRASVGNQIEFRYVLADCYFACAQTMQLIKTKIGKDFVMGVKDNRTVALRPEDKKNGRYVSIKSLDLQEGDRRIVHFKVVPFPLALIKKVFPNKDGSEDVLHLITSDTTIGYDRILVLYDKPGASRAIMSRSRKMLRCPHSPPMPCGHRPITCFVRSVRSLSSN